MLLDQVGAWPAAVEYVNSLEDELCVLTGWSLQRNLFSLEAGEEPCYINRELQIAWNEAYNTWRKEVGELDRDFLKSLCDNGTLELVEYEEIWNG
jgi:hypothetical protein